MMLMMMMMSLVRKNRQKLRILLPVACRLVSMVLVVYDLVDEQINSPSLIYF